MNKKSMCFIFYLLIMAFSVSKVEAAPSVSAWRITNGQSQILILGEMHDFDLMAGQTIDHSLGYAALSWSNQLWTENVEPDTATHDFKNSNRMSADSWSKVSSVVTQNLSEILRNRSEEDRNNTVKKILNMIDKSEPTDGYQSLALIATPIYRKSLKIKVNRVTGFGKTIEVSELYKKKIFRLEASDVNRTVWQKNCDSGEYVEKVFIKALSYFEAKSYDSSSVYLLSQVVLKFNNSLLETDLTPPIRDFELDAITKCNVIPRNKIWFPQIEKSLNTAGSMHVFSVGLSHVLGDQGLLEMLRKAGYTDIKRIGKID
jgi:TraB/PrgY/gumN family